MIIHKDKTELINNRATVLKGVRHFNVGIIMIQSVQVLLLLFLSVKCMF